jgi:Tfp pilus assembly protein PilE
MNKKGFLLGEETVKIILAIIAILVLIVFIVYLYNNYTQNQDLTNAKASLASLVSQINSGATQFNIYNPPNWVLSSWSSSTSPIIHGAANMPSQCSTSKWNNCLCLCAAPGGSVKTFLVACNTKGTCLPSNFIVQGDDINFGNNLPQLLNINQQTKTISKNN